MSATGNLLDACTVPERCIFLKDAGMIPFGLQFGDGQALAERVSTEKPVHLLAYEGILVAGGVILESFDRLEVLEATAETRINSRPFGALRATDEARLGELRAAFLS